MAERDEPVRDPHPERARDPEFLRSVLSVLRPILKLWHRSEVHGLEQLPAGGSLVVSNHSGGLFAMDFPTLAVDFYDRFGTGRPLYLLAHEILFGSPLATSVMKAGLIPASREVAQRVLAEGATLVVFPGGDYDAARPSWRSHLIDFHGRTGYVTTALSADVPIVPTVSIGGHENQLYLTRGESLTRWLGLQDRLRLTILPVTVGLPWGPSLGFLLPMNVPLPTKIVTQVLEPIDVRAEFGDEPDPGVVDAHVRKVMQAALDELRTQRRLPVIG